MCGIAALVSADGRAGVAHVRAMCDIARHRGPDGEGYALFRGADGWAIDGPDTPEAARATRSDQAPAEGEVVFGHRRLAIVAVGSEGHQPMAVADGRYWITYNGEIYNHPELRDLLEREGWGFRTMSDTEVILAAYARWGEACLERLNGMFAFVLYDRAAGRLFAARDRFGVKPLYLWRGPDRTLALASEIKQFTVLPGWRAQVEGQRAYDYLNWGISDHGEATMFAGVRQLPAGGCISGKLHDLTEHRGGRRWYSLPLRPDAPERPEVAIERWRELFLDAVRLRLRADVPVGTALSGGLDSSAIVCAAHALLQGSGGAEQQNAFSARSHDPRFDEGEFMAEVVARTRVRHHVVWPDAERLAADLDALTWHLDEPYGSTSVFGAWCVYASVAATPVKVTLDGHGADEILGGYTACAGPHLAAIARAGRAGALWREARALRRTGRHSLGELAASTVDDLAPAPVRSLLRRFGGKTVGRPDWLDLTRLGAVPGDPYADSGGRGKGLSGLALSHLQHTSMPMQLRWADRTSMAHAIESRAPFLDYRLVELTLGLPVALKLAGGESKLVLRRALASLLPPKIAQRRDKKGFTTPEPVWVRDDRPDLFRSWVHEAIARADGILTPAAAVRAEEIISGRRRFHAALWRMIAFGAWMHRFDVAMPASADAPTH
jgi:asparagine synthase (glutamine-hydrolysing)